MVLNLVKIMRNFIHLPIIALIIFLFSGCDKNNDSSIDEPTIYDADVLTFQVNGFIDDVLLASTKQNHIHIQDKQAFQHKDFAVTVGISESKSASLIKNKIQNSINSNEKNAVSYMKNTSLYRLVVFEKNTNKLIADKTVKAYTIGRVPVSRGVEYQWIAYTYDDSEEFESNPITINSNGVITSFKYQTVQNKPFMVAKGSTSIQQDQSSGVKKQHVSILFKQKTARVRVTVDLSNIKNNVYIKSGTITSTNAKMYHGEYDFLSGEDGAYIKHTAYTSNFILNIPENTKANKANSNYQYTSKLDAIGEFPLKLNTSWGYTSQSGLEPTGASISGNDERNIFQFNLQTGFVFAKSYDIIMKVSLANYVKFDELYWARFNLFYSPSDGTYDLRDNHLFPVGSFELRDTSTTNATSTNNRGNYGVVGSAVFKATSNRVDYFRPGYLNIHSDNSISSSKDPCKLVGDKLWRLPTKAEYQKLIDLSTNYRNGLFEFVLINSKNENYISNDRVNFYRYGKLNLKDNTWTPQSVGYNYSYLLSSQVEGGEGNYLYKTTTGFGVFRTGLLEGNAFYAFKDNIAADEPSAYSIRCVRDVPYGIPWIDIDPFD